jgi:outer membrane receptor protein involved in Fe transport
MVARMAFAATLFVWPSAVLAQGTGRLVGAVLDASTLGPLPGARADVVGGGLSATTDASGTLTLAAVPVGEVTLRIALPGYGTVVESFTVTPGETTFVQFHMLRIHAALDELLVQVDRGAVRQSAAEERVSGQGPASMTAADLLQQRVPGVTVDRSSGAIGGGAKVLIRGLSSMSGSNAPAIYLDGVPIGDRSSPLRGSREPQSFHVLEQIPARDVRQIRVLRGPAATARYAGAANGVILIETRRGGAGGSG